MGHGAEGCWGSVNARWTRRRPHSKMPRKQLRKSRLGQRGCSQLAGSHVFNGASERTAPRAQEAFVKVQEQGKAYLLRREEHLHGLNLINSTNLDYFTPQHQAEMIDLKAQLLQALGEDDAGERGGVPFFLHFFLFGGVESMHSIA